MHLKNWLHCLLFNKLTCLFFPFFPFLPVPNLPLVLYCFLCRHFSYLPAFSMRKCSSPKSGGHGIGCPGKWVQSNAAGVQKVLGKHSWTLGLNFGLSSTELGVGDRDPCGSLPTLDIQWFRNVYLITFSKCHFIVYLDILLPKIV